MMESPEEAPSGKMLIRKQVGRARHLAADDAAPRQTVEHLVSRLVAHLAGEQGKQLRPAARQVLAIHKRRPFIFRDTERFPVLSELIVRRRDERDPAVAAAMRPDAGRGTALAPRMLAGVLDPQQRQDRREGLEFGDLDEPPAPALETGDQGRERGHEGAHTAGIAQDVPWRLQRGAPLVAVQAGIAGQSLDH